MADHDSVVAAITIQVRDFYTQKLPFRIYHGSTNSTRPSPYTRTNIVDISRLSRVLSVDTTRRVAEIEPNVSMGALVEATLPHGLLPPVVPEFPAITAGGAFAGLAGESGSLMHGSFDMTVDEIDVVLADGEVVTANAKERADLFYGAAGSFGTLGIVTRLRVRLVPSKGFVKLDYLPIAGVNDAVEEAKASRDDNEVEFFDAILFARNLGVVMKGYFVDGPYADERVSRYSRARDQWFYRNAQKHLERNPSSSWSEVIPVVDYLFRYDRGAFWTGKYAFQYFCTPFNRITRYVLDHFMHTKVMYHALHVSGHASSYVVQDIGFPYEMVGKFTDYVDKELGYYPLWLCPVARDGFPLEPRMLQREAPSEPRKHRMYMNVGCWCPGPRDTQKFIALNREIERKTNDLRGLKVLYAHAYYTEEEFWTIYDREGYEALRQKYNATSLPSVYTKISSAIPKPRIVETEGFSSHLSALFWSIWPMTGLYGVAKVILGGNYLIKKAE